MGARARLRTEFLTRIQTLLERVIASEHLPVDAAIDQVVRNNLRARLPPVFPCSAEQPRNGSSSHDGGSHDATLDSLVRLIRHDVAHLAVEEESIVLYHAAGNTCRYQEAGEGAVLCSLCVAPALEYLIGAYPSWTSVRDLPAEDDDAMAAIIDVISELLRARVLTTISSQ